MLKKMCAFLIVLSLIIPSVCFAKAGDAAGNLYYTDITAYINHSPVTSYNTGGRTVIDAEILNWHYGFDVYWRPTERRLEITDKGGIFESLQAMSGSLVQKAEGKTGEIFAKCYETDIVTLLNGKPIEAVNIDGRTFIFAENMCDHGYDVLWNEEKRTLVITKPSDFYKIETDFGTIKTRENYQTVFDGFNIYQDNKTDANLIYKTRKIKTLQESALSDNVLYGPHQFASIKLSDAEIILNAEITLKEEKITNESSYINGIDFKTEEFQYTVLINYDEKNISESAEFFEQEEFMDANLKNVYSLSVPLVVNGKDSAFVNPNPKTGGEYEENILIADGEIYVPIYTIQKLLNKSSEN